MDKDHKEPCQRRLKIYSKSAERDCMRNINVSEIRLIGKWLEDYGFKIGNTVTLQVESGKITIVPDEPKPIDAPEVKRQDKAYQRKLRRISPRVG